MATKPAAPKKLEDPIKAAEVALSVLRGQTTPASQDKAKDLLERALDQLLGEEKPAKKAEEIPDEKQG